MTNSFPSESSSSSAEAGSGSGLQVAGSGAESTEKPEAPSSCRPQPGTRHPEPSASYPENGQPPTSPARLSKRLRIRDWEKPKTALPEGYCDRCGTRATCTEMCQPVADLLRFTCGSHKSVAAGPLPLDPETGQPFCPETAKPYTWAQRRRDEANGRRRAAYARDKGDISA